VLCGADGQFNAADKVRSLERLQVFSLTHPHSEKLLALLPELESPY
jgi:hypothetical protein